MPGSMDRETILRDLDEQISNLARLHILHGLHQTDGFHAKKADIQAFIRKHKIDVRAELHPLSFNLYQRYFY